MGKVLEREYIKALKNVELFKDLQKCSELDFPQNLNYIYIQNFKLLLDYYKFTMCSFEYIMKTDYIIRTLIYNYVASIKSYLNRKRKRIDIIVPNEYKTAIQSILEKYWKAKRRETAIDKIVCIRDVYEHEKIADLEFIKEIYTDKIIYTLKYQSEDFLDLAQKCINELAMMNTEIEHYIASALDSLNLRENCLFLNAFSRKYKNKNYTVLLPEETEFEKGFYDNDVNPKVWT